MKFSRDKILIGMEKKYFFVLSSLILWFSLEFSYRFFIVPIYSYTGFVNNVVLIKYIEAITLYCVMAFLAPNILTRPSDYLMNFLFFSLMAPLFVLYAFTDQSRLHLYIVVSGYFLINLFRRGRPIKIPFIRNGYTIVFVLLVFLSLIVTLWLFFSGGYRYLNFDLTAVYDFREDVGEIINAGLMGYINTWAFKVFGPALLAVGLWKKKHWLVILAFSLHFVWFGISSHKSVLFYPFLITFLWIWFSRTRALSLVPLGMSLVVFSCVFIFLIFDYGFLGSMFIRRVFFVTADNTFYYYNFFSDNPFVYWSNSITSFLIEYPYHVGPAKLIGESRGTGSNVNNTFLSTGFMHAGVLGIWFYSILAGLIFRLIDSFSKYGVPIWVAIAVVIVPGRALLLTTDLPTALLTHGIGIALVVLMLLRTKNKTLI